MALPEVLKRILHDHAVCQQEREDGSHAVAPTGGGEVEEFLVLVVEDVVAGGDPTASWTAGESAWHRQKNSRTSLS